jgi:hypothetical protein
MTVFLRGRATSAGTPTLAIVASNSQWSTGVPAITFPQILPDDRIILVGISQHDVAANKTLTTPSGFTALVSHTSNPDYVCNQLVVTKTAVSGDEAIPFGFGGSCRRIDGIVVRGGGTIAGQAQAGVLGNNSTVYEMASRVPAAGGLDLISFVGSELESTVGATPSGYTAIATVNSNYQTGGFYSRTSAPSPTGAVRLLSSSSGGSVSYTAVSINVAAS